MHSLILSIIVHSMVWLYVCPSLYFLSIHSSCPSVYHSIYRCLSSTILSSVDQLFKDPVTNSCICVTCLEFGCGWSLYLTSTIYQCPINSVFIFLCGLLTDWSIYQLNDRLTDWWAIIEPVWKPDSKLLKLTGLERLGRDWNCDWLLWIWEFESY